MLLFIWNNLGVSSLHLIFLDFIDRAFIDTEDEIL